MVECALILLFLFLLCGFVAFGEWLNDKFQWINTDEEFDSIEHEQLCMRCKRKVS